MNITDKFIWLQSGNGIIEILAPYNEVKDVATTGDNMEACKKLLSNPLVQAQTAYFSSDTLIALIEEYGNSLSKGEKGDRETLLLTALWLLSWDAIENEENAMATTQDVREVVAINNLEKLFI